MRIRIRNTALHFDCTEYLLWLQAQVKPCIEKLNNDSDFDVRYYASEAAMGKDWVPVLSRSGYTIQKRMETQVKAICKQSK